MTTTEQHDIVVSRTAQPLDEEPDESDIIEWLARSLSKIEPDRSTEVSVQILTRTEIKQLNAQFRGRDAATNVLSFPSETPLEDDRILLGDIAVCSEVILDEAREYQKPFRSRFAHIVIHGLLHLLGYDHIVAADQSRMEKMETELLLDLDISNPYEIGAFP